MGRLASAAVELQALQIGITLRELHGETQEAHQMIEDWLVQLEARKPALSEQR